MSYRKERLRVRKRFASLMQAFKELFYYGCEVDSWLPEIMLLPYITLQWKKDPTWYRIIAPPGCGKSKHLSLLEGFEFSYIIDDFTPKALISGFRGLGEDPSKLPQLDGKVVIIQDESTLMEQRKEDRNIVQTILRKAYDGRVTKAFGNIAEKQNYQSHFNLLVASTPAIDRYFLYQVALGERYINYRAQIPNRREIAVRAFNNQFIPFTARYEKLRKKVHRFLGNMPAAEMTDVKFPKAIQRLFIDCADFIALIRTHVTRDSSGRHVTTLPQAESAGRLVQQMSQTAIADAIIHGDSCITIEHATKAIYLGIGSVMAIISFMLYHVIDYSKSHQEGPYDAWFALQQMVIRTALGRITVGKILEDLAIHRVLDIRQGAKQGGRLVEYRINRNAYDMIAYAGIFRHYIPVCHALLNVRQKDRARPTGNLPRRRKKVKRK